MDIDKKRALRFANLCRIAYKNELEIQDQLRVNYDVVKFLSCGTTQAICLVNKTEVIIVFRGTKVEIRKAEPKTWWQKILYWISGESKTVDFGDIKTDLDFKKEDFHGLGEVHRGFKKAFDLAIDEIIKFLSEHKTAGKDLFITGHSLGGALSVLLAAYLRHKGIGFTTVWTYGQPRVFSQDSAPQQAALYEDHLYRFINSIDIVPRVPLYLQGYSHFGKVYFFDRSGKFHQDITFLYRLWLVIRDFATLRTVIRSLKSALDLVRSIGREAVKDHNIEKYVQLLEENL